MMTRGLGLTAWLFLVLAIGCGPKNRVDDDIADDGGGDVDSDGDGFTVSGGDCNDSDPLVNPGTAEVCGDGIDNNCNGMMDSGDYACMTPCERAAFDRSSVGCVYYGVDTNQLGGPYAMAVSNVDPASSANVVIEQNLGGVWTPISGGTFAVAPRSLQTVTPARAYVGGSAYGLVYRITSDLPVIAYQFAPVDGSASYLSDASLLLPSSALDEFYLVPAWPQGAADQCSQPQGWPAHIQIAAIAGGATVTVTAPTATLAGTGVPALAPGVPQQFTIDEGSFLQLTVAQYQTSLDGTYIESSAPVAVFSSNDCANVPNTCEACCCEHLEEQIFGLQTWGTSYVAAQMPRRNNESSVWHILAQQDNTTVTFTPAPGVTGVPAEARVLNARQKLELEVSGGPPTGADFLVTADKPIHVNQYTVGSLYAGTGDSGDPDMIQAIPTEQYLSSYVILVPSTWLYDFVVLTRRVGSTISVDSVPVTTGWTAVAGEWEATRYPLADGVHVIDGSQPFGVSVSGWDMFDSYSYPGGLNQTVINPIE
jgi:hypothetical protein